MTACQLCNIDALITRWEPNKSWGGQLLAQFYNSTSITVNSEVTGQTVSPRAHAFLRLCTRSPNKCSCPITFPSFSARQHSHLPSMLCEMCRSFNHNSNGLVLYEWRLSMQLFWKVWLTKIPTRGDSRKPESKINIRLCHEATQEAASSSCHLWWMYTGARE